jgi:hypothetical protein
VPPWLLLLLLLLQVAGLRERLAEMKAELGGQRSAKQQAQLQLAAKQAELATLYKELDLLKEQALSLQQQQVSAFQQGSLLTGGANGTERERGRPLERSPSRTLASRMREQLSSSPWRGNSGAASESRSSMSLCSLRGTGSSSCASPRAMPELAGASTESHLPAAAVSRMQPGGSCSAACSRRRRSSSSRQRQQQMLAQPWQEYSGSTRPACKR